MEHPRATGPGALPRRRVLGLSALGFGLAALGTAGCTASGATAALGPVSTPVRAASPPGVLGANVNQNLDDIDPAQLRAIGASWVRGFYPLQNADQGDVADQPGMTKLVSASRQGYGTVLNLKFVYDQGLPAVGSPGMRVALRRLDAILPVVMGTVDIIVVGNEPFYECGGRTTGLNEFYEAVAQHVIEHRRVGAAPGRNTQIYMGALTRLDAPKPEWAPQLDRWLDFVARTPAIAGTDCHPHVASLADCQTYVDKVVPHLRTDQSFLATEFSMVKLWKTHLADPISDQFADQYHIPRGTKVWQATRNAVHHPVPQQQWNDFLLSNTWYAQNAQSLSAMMAIFRRSGRCTLAGYGITQDAGGAHDFGPDKTPWVFNSVFCPYTVQRGADGLPGRNTTWAGQFRALQQT